MTVISLFEIGASARTKAGQLRDKKANLERLGNTIESTGVFYFYKTNYIKPTHIITNELAPDFFARYRYIPQRLLHFTDDDLKSLFEISRFSRNALEDAIMNRDSNWIHQFIQVRKIPSKGKIKANNQRGKLAELIVFNELDKFPYQLDTNVLLDLDNSVYNSDVEVDAMIHHPKGRHIALMKYLVRQPHLAMNFHTQRSYSEYLRVA